MSSEERLKQIFNNDFETINFKKMKKITQPIHLFGEDFLWSSLMQIKK